MFLKNIIVFLQDLEESGNLTMSHLTGLDLVEQTVHDVAPGVADLWILDREYNATEIVFSQLANFTMQATNMLGNMSKKENISEEVLKYLAEGKDLKFKIQKVIDSTQLVLEALDRASNMSIFQNHCANAESLKLLTNTINKLHHKSKFSFPHTFNQRQLLDQVIDHQMDLMLKITNCSLDKAEDIKAKEDLKKLLEEMLVYFYVFAFDDEVNVEGTYLMEVIDPNCQASVLIDKCTCQCYKKRKLQAFRIYQKILYLQNLHIENLGNVIVWLLRNKLEGFKFRDNRWVARAYDEFGEEFIDFDRDLFKQLIGSEMEIGLTDFITLLSTPSEAFNKHFEIPGLNTFPDNVRKEVMSLFNYSYLFDRDQEMLYQPDLKTRVCSKEGIVETNLTSYCKLAQKMPPLQKIMPLLRLAKHPVKRYKDIGNVKFPDLKQKVARMTNLTMVPVCLHERRSYTHWLSAKKHPENSSENDNSGNSSNLDMSDWLYQYPPCLGFENRPSDIGLCSTYNGLDIR